MGTFCPPTSIPFPSEKYVTEFKYDPKNPCVLKRSKTRRSLQFFRFQILISSSIPREPMVAMRLRLCEIAIDFTRCVWLTALQDLEGERDDSQSDEARSHKV